MQNFYLVTLSESLIFLGFSRLSEILTMGVIWREETIFAERNCWKCSIFNSLMGIKWGCNMEGRKFASKMHDFCADIIILTYRKHSSIKGFRAWVNPTLWGERVTQAKSYTRLSLNPIFHCKIRVCSYF